MIKNIAGAWCLVTGAASGIGRRTAELLSKKGARLVLCDIQKEAVDSLACELRERGGEALSYGVDVSDLQEMQALANWLDEKIGALDVLVNNAGVIRAGGYNESSFDDWHAVMNVNLWGVIHASKLLIPQMVERCRGSVVNVASASGNIGFSQLTAYSTSKFAVVGFSHALRAELDEAGVSVSVVCPSFVKTDLAKNSGLSETDQKSAALVMEKHGIEPDEVALAIVRAIETGTAHVNVGKEAKALGLLARIAPGQASTWLTKLANRERSQT